MFFKKKYIKAVKSKIYDYVVMNYKLMDESKFVLGEIPYNYKCHLNSIQKVKEGKAKKVIACVTVEKSTWENIIVHFINELDDGTCQDNTWGWTYKDQNYYFVKELSADEFDNIDNLLGYLQACLLRSNSSWITRKLFRIKTIV
jgi:hypothetical protein